MKYKNLILFLFLGAIMSNLLGCAAMQTEISKRNLDVQTRMTKTIFLDPASSDKKRVYIQVRNTSGQRGYNLQHRLAYAMEKKGYIIESNPDKAHYLIQANVLQISRVNLREANSAFESGFGGGLLGATIAGVAGAGDRAVLAAGLAGGMIGMAADAIVKDNYYTIITDVQLAERSDAVKELTVSRLSQGTSSRKIQTSSQREQWKKYQTRIVSTANRANLKLAQATPILADELVRSIAGLM